MDPNEQSGPSANSCHVSDFEKVVSPLFEGFQSLFEQVQLLGRQHASLERKLAVAQAHVSMKRILFHSFLSFI